MVTIEGFRAASALGAVNSASACRSTRAAPSAAARQRLRDIDFRRGTDGEGRVVVDLADTKTGASTCASRARPVVVDFQGTRLPENLRRRLDVTDFGTPGPDGHAPRSRATTCGMVIEPQGLWEHNAYQSDTQFVVEVKPIKEDPNKLTQGTRQGYRGERLSLNFQNVDVRALLQVIADFTNLNIITSDSVGGNLTLRLKDVPWDQALDIVLQSQGPGHAQERQCPADRAARRTGDQGEARPRARAQIADLEPLRTETFTLNYQKAEDVRQAPGRRRSSACCPSAAARWSMRGRTRCSSRTCRRGSTRSAA